MSGWRSGGSRGWRTGGQGWQAGADCKDWYCLSCKYSNFASRSSCHRCGQPRDSGGAGHVATGVESLGGDLIDWDTVDQESVRAVEQRMASLPPLIKDLYEEDLEVAAMTPVQVQQFREESFDLKVCHTRADSMIPIPNPVRTFSQAFKRFPGIMQEIEKQGFAMPTPIQCQAWPILLQGYDMIGIAQTGTGKTLAFLMPALLHVVAQPTPRSQRPGPTVLVLAPTRELAQQIEKEAIKYHYQGINCVCVYGQGDRRLQQRKISAKAEIVVATPGRLNEFAEKGIVDLSWVSYLILDEADRMLDMGFEPQIRKLILYTRPDRQSVMTSATWPEGVRDLANKLLRDPLQVVVGSLDLKAASTVRQCVLLCDEETKKTKLLEFIQDLSGEDKAIVFVARKVKVDLLSVDMMNAGVTCVVTMHGDREQVDREAALHDLRTGRARVLIATDVAARGIDVTDVTHILNYDCPRDMEEYVHRVGRTGRAGRTGSACTLVTRHDWSVSPKLVEILEKSNQEVPVELYKMKARWEQAKAERGLKERGGRFGGKSSRW